MTNRYYSEFEERKLPQGGGKRAPTETIGTPIGQSKVQEKTANWSAPGPSPGTGFNRKTRCAVVKTTAKKAGMP